MPNPNVADALKKGLSNYVDTHGQARGALPYGFSRGGNAYNGKPLSYTLY
jgi:hypothetical protein